MIRTVRHVGIVVKSIGTILPFYRDILGLKVVREAQEPAPFIDQLLGFSGCSLITVKLASDEGETLIELLEFQSPAVHSFPQSGLSDPGITHIALTVRNIDDLYSRLIKEGIEFVSPPIISPDGHAKVAFCQDPSGNYLELVEERS